MKSWGRHILLFTYFSLVLVTNVWKGWHPQFFQNIGIELHYIPEYSSEATAEGESSFPHPISTDSDSELHTILVPIDHLPFEHFLYGSKLPFQWNRDGYSLPSLEINTPPPQV